jgi:hypothetical protein
VEDEHLRNLHDIDECAPMLGGRALATERIVLSIRGSFYRYDPKCGRADHNAHVFQYLLRLASCQAWPSIW